MTEPSVSDPGLFPSGRVRQRMVVLAAAGSLLVLLLAGVMGYCARRSTEAAAVPASAPTASSVGTPVSGLRTVAVAGLPPQARDTLALIDKGGPFPYSRDGIVFGNNESILPARTRGYYREYTVPTPGERDRGARRLVVGRDGDVYYTDDHYDSFWQVIR